eukprot:EG_transcript_23897
MSKTCRFVKRLVEDAMEERRLKAETQLMAERRLAAEAAHGAPAPHGLLPPPTAQRPTGSPGGAPSATSSTSPAQSPPPGGFVAVNGVAFPATAPPDFPGEPACEICMVRRRTAAILDCGHAQFCLTCLREYVEQASAPSPPCPMCKATITRVIHIVV